ncbi:MAG: hypothetical protein A2639_00775 [Candidatus Staskawiczbacteria bacterium RIFCSPHIGHO2_01_FULL_34_27]|uniref:Uncharacterized protein n=2 Tax=Candidatus Staskawicziibacteriota TaxID=1817916 RepID=A0A1G2HK96_9BACT|nr:MAG: hypothetical protein A2639_00775 [Candidatus Staskawiczbacteria bacterium RIFCSPHIGHO2_01_FULL_34_27]OGZ69022.1 MAG: hypothetical protein A3D35_02700 [Candidatus Staskawiczbacteria bacterium RIFCSPHIGHO2_02_FULL_34_9]
MNTEFEDKSKYQPKRQSLWDKISQLLNIAKFIEILFHAFLLLLAMRGDIALAIFVTLGGYLLIFFTRATSIDTIKEKE